MARPSITEETRLKLLESFREFPGNCYAAANHAGVVYRTAKRAWFVGDPRHGLEPMIKTVTDERELARAKLFDDHEVRKRQELEKEVATRLEAADVEAASRINVALAKAKAKMDAAETIAQEVQLVRSARGVAAAMNDLVRVAMTNENRTNLARLITKALKSEDLSPRDIAMLCRAFGELSRDAQDTGQVALKMERMIAGEPTEILKVQVVDATLEEADSAAAALARAIANAREVEAERLPLEPGDQQ